MYRRGRKMASFYSVKWVEAGTGALNKVGDIVKSIGKSSIFLLMDPSLVNNVANVNHRVEKLFEDNNIKFTLFSDYSGEPTIEHVNAGLQVLKSNKCDCVVAIGGGSAMDLAKAIALFSESPELPWGEIVNQNQLKRLPLIAIPTTSGTGSEATKITVIIDTVKKIKINPNHQDLIPDVAILDPELIATLPKNFTAFTGMDALGHAMEAYVSNKSTLMSDFYAVEAIKLVGKYLKQAYDDGLNLEAREGMTLASYYAGLAFSNSSTNLAHAAGRVLGVHFNVPHGLAIALLLPFVMRFGLEVCEERYAEVAIALGADPGKKTKADLAKEAISIVEDYNEGYDIWNAAKQYIKDKDEFSLKIPAMVTDALSGGGILTNRKLPNEDHVTDIFNLLCNKL